MLQSNCVILIRLGTPGCSINNDRQISVESQHNFHFLPHLISKTAEPIFTHFLSYVQEFMELLMRAFTKRYCKRVQNATSKSEGSERSWTKRGKIIDAGRKTT